VDEVDGCHRGAEVDGLGVEEARRDASSALPPAAGSRSASALCQAERKLAARGWRNSL
jgi:hypothetical protein